MAISNLSPRDTENTKKNICEIFKEYNLSITIEANLKVVNFLDVQLDLEKGTFKPFAKPNDKLNYVNSQSNHPPGIIKNIPKSVNKRLSKLSATKEVFDEAAKSYQDELNEKGYKYKLEYEATTKTAKKRRNRSRNVTYFNPPYSKSVKTNVGAKFLAIISKNFPAKHPLHKILNRNTVKIGYRCMPNIKACIDKHNMQVLRQDDQVQTGNGCNCLVSRKADCPIPGKCATESVIYRASVRRYDTCTVDCYTGLTGDKFKTRYTQHQSDIRTGKNTKSKLAFHVCNLKSKNIQHDISWEIVTRAPQFNHSTRVCRLCLMEAYHIIFTPGGANLNKRDELFGFCKHKEKNLLRKHPT